MATRDPMRNRVVRVSEEDWAAYEEACAAKGISRSDDLRMHIKREVAAHRRRMRDEAAALNAGRMPLEGDD